MRSTDPFFREISAQPDALRRAAAGLRDQLPELKRLPALTRFHDLVFTGMGGSYDLSYAPVTALARAGILATMVDSAELLYFRDRALSPQSLVVVASQSGESAEVVRLVELLRRDSRPFLVSVTNGLANSVARAADVALDTRAGTEVGPSTLTFGAGLVVMSAIADILSGASCDEAVSRVELTTSPVAGSIERTIARGEAIADHMASWLSTRNALYLLARGADRSASEMGALTLKEAARFPAESMQTAQFRHGPLEAADNGAGVILFVTQPSTREVDLRLAADLEKQSTAVFVIDSEDPAGASASVTVGRLDPVIGPAAAIVPIQLLAWRLALNRGFNPGSYIRASKVTRRE